MKYLFLVNQQKDGEGRLVGFFGYESGHKMELAYKGTLPGDSREDLEACEILFRMFNVERPADYRNRSMSVGDVVVLQEWLELPRAYACLAYGFGPVTIPDRRLLQIVMEGIEA
jgi:hypothetical protein